MTFVELCPYVSDSFTLDEPTVEALSRSDSGFGIVASMRKLLIEEAEPALVLVNGKDAVWDFERIHEAELKWTEQRYPSVDCTSKMFWHKTGTYMTPSGKAVSIAGVPFPSCVNRGPIIPMPS